MPQGTSTRQAVPAFRYSKRLNRVVETTQAVEYQPPTLLRRLSIRISSRRRTTAVRVVAAQNDGRYPRPFESTLRELVVLCVGVARPIDTLVLMMAYFKDCLRCCAYPSPGRMFPLCEKTAIVRIRTQGLVHCSWLVIKYHT